MNIYIPMKMPSWISKLLMNRYVLYIVSLLALFNVLGYAMLGNTQIVMLFILVGFLMTYFSKNMVVVLLVPLVFVNLLTSGKAIKEGLENNNTDNSSSSSTSPIPTQTPTSTTSGTQQCKEGEKWSDSESKCVPTDGFAGAGAKKGASRVDMGSTLEQAYDDLNNVLGGDGIKNLTVDTQNLMKQQLQLAEAMKGMGPLVKQAQDMLQTLNIDGIGDLSSLVKKMGVGTNSNAN